MSTSARSMWAKRRNAIALLRGTSLAVCREHDGRLLGRQSGSETRHWVAEAQSPGCPESGQLATTSDRDP